MKIRLTTILILFTLSACGQTANFGEIQKLYDQGKLQETIDLSSKEIQKLKSSDPIYKKIILLRVDCYMRLSDFKSAINDWKLLIGIDPKNVANYSGISYAYWANNDISNCLESIHKAYEINPKDAGTLSNMSYYYSQAGKYEESINFSNIGLEQNNLQTALKMSLLNNRAFSYIGLKQFNKAIADVNASITVEPDNSYAYCYRALANIGLNKMDTVCQDLEKSKGMGGVTLTRDLIVQHCK
jgi:tetratricopeptide (TPR) repeat protein